MVDTLRPFYWTDREHMRALLNTIDRRQLRFVMVDSLSRSHLGDENSVQDMAPVVNTWADVCQQFNVAVPIIHHFTKSGTGTLLQQLRGSGSIGAVVRHLIGVEKSATRGDPFELSFEGNLHPLADPFKIEMRDELDSAGNKIITFARHGGVAPVSVETRLEQHENSEAVWGALQVLRDAEIRQDAADRDANGQLKPIAADIVRARSKMGAAAIRAALNDCARLGMVSKPSGRGYLLTAIGRAFVDRKR